MCSIGPISSPDRAHWLVGFPILMAFLSVRIGISCLVPFSGSAFESHQKASLPSYSTCMTTFLLGILLTPLDPTIEENFLDQDGEGGSAVLIKFRFYHVFHVSIFTVRKSSYRKVMLYKCLSVHREGGCLLHCMLGYTPQADINPRTDRYPPGQTHTPWTDTHTPWTDTHTHSPGQTHIPQAYTHPKAYTPQADNRLGRHPPTPRRKLQWTVRILLECIPVVDGLSITH